MGEIEREKKYREKEMWRERKVMGEWKNVSAGGDCNNFEFISLVFEVYIFLSYSEN